jgi:apolipoprotein N-acyltransferase
VATLTPPRDFFAPGAMTRISEGRVSPAERAAVDDQLARLHDWFLDGSRREARAGARLLVWPEQNLLVFATDEARFLERARGLAAEEHVYLAMGLGTVHLGEPLPMENKLVLVDPSGTIVASYHKRHAVPGWESRIMRRGALPVPVVPTAMGRLALAICFDADFPAFIRQAGAQSADVLLLPSNDWRAIRWSHAQMAAFRAIENGVSLVRSAASGVTTVVDPWGRVLAVRDDFAPGDHAMTAQLSIGRVPTLYARTGDLFAWCCVGALVVALAMSVSPTYRIERVRAVPGAARADLPTHPAPMPTRSMST